METLTQFIAMGGYGLYVWSAYASMLVLLGLPWLAIKRRWKKFYITKQAHE